MKLSTKLFWISILYFIEGLPYGFVYDVLPFYFRQHGLSLKDIGFMFWLTLPWAIKVLWSPFVDRFGQRRSWISAACVAMAAIAICVPLFDPASPTLLLYAVLLAFTIASATQDIAIDAYAIGLVSRGEEGLANGYRFTMYRVALMLGGGGTMFLVDRAGWTAVFLTIGLAFLALAFTAWVTPPVPVVHQPAREWARNFWAFLSRRGAIAIFAFIFTYRIGDIVMGPMVKPFWSDRGMSAAQTGTVSTIFGVVIGLCGAMVGGYVISRIGIFHGLWVMGLAQAVSNLAYAAVAQFDLARGGLYGASMMESFTAGLGSATFLAFLMRICDKDQAATQYALLTCFFGLTRLLGGGSGWVVEHVGYAAFFTMTGLGGLSWFLFLPWVRLWIGNGDGGLHSAPQTAAPSRGSSSSSPAPASAR